MRYEYVLSRPAFLGTHPVEHLIEVTTVEEENGNVYDVAAYTEPLDRDTVNEYELEERPLHAWRTHIEVTPATLPLDANTAKYVMLCAAPYHWRENEPTVTIDRIPVPKADAKRIIDALPAWSRWAIEWLIDGILHAADLKDLTPNQVARLTARMRREGTATPWSL